MIETPVYQIPLIEVERPPTEDELPYDDGVPMETWRHKLQMDMLLDPLYNAWSGRDFFAGGNMFVYFSPHQVRDYDFRDPDVFVVLDVPYRERKSWVVWEEGKAPDVIIELLSESTAHVDKGEKKRIYQNRLRTPEYFWYDPFNYELAGFALQKGVYQPIKPDKQGRLFSNQLNLMLVQWEGKFKGTETSWLRWATPEGHVLPTDEESKKEAQQQAAEAQQQAAEAQQQAAKAEQHTNELAAVLERYRQQYGDLPAET